MYGIFTYIGVVLGVNGAAYMAVPWSVWDLYDLQRPVFQYLQLVYDMDFSSS